MRRIGQRRRAKTGGGPFDRRCRSNLIDPDDLTPRIKGAQGGAYTIAPRHDDEEHKVDLDAVLLRAERRLIEQALRRARGNKSRAAELLSISRPRLYRRMVTLGMEGAEAEAYAAVPSHEIDQEPLRASEAQPETVRRQTNDERRQIQDDSG
ncbi:MAG: hypothetical protein HY000_14170 [Planctomycetes bacterium]|nr:hypothetical protein [Planctomycetota bacterium]